MALSRKYIAIEYDEITQHRLRNWCYNNEIDISQSYSGNSKNPLNFRFHTTLIYSVNEIKLENKIVNLGKSYKVDAIELAYVTDNIPIIKIESKDIRELIQYYKIVHEITHSYNDHLLHISISYNSDKDLSDLMLPTFNLSFDKLIIEDIDE